MIHCNITDFYRKGEWIFVEVETYKGKRLLRFDRESFISFIGVCYDYYYLEEDL